MIEYRDIPGFPGYRACSDGSIWSCRDFQGGTRAPWRQLNFKPGKRGYVNAGLRQDGKYVYMGAHGFVLLAFVGPAPAGHEACHWNNDRSDNRIENLRWGTDLENQHDRARHGTLIFGSAIAQAKLTEAQVAEIRDSSESSLVLSQRFRVGRGAINNIRARRRWRSVA